MILKPDKASPHSPRLRTWLFCVLVALLPVSVLGVGGPKYVSTSWTKGFFTLSAKGNSTSLLISANDYPGVIRALADLKTDIGKVTGSVPELLFDKLPKTKELVIVGTLGKSELIDQLVKAGKLDVNDIVGKWEAFTIQVIEKPFPGVDKALVIVGSDKRATIFGIYDLSEEIGVSPWYFWADVPVPHQDALYVKPGKFTQSPSVQYRGIFINDEAPALTNWVYANYGSAKESKNPPVGKYVANYGHEFYTKVFELLLRIKANYLWPAMWSNAFNEDDTENPRLADEYGIVMGTSHQEPMVRSQQEWDRRYYQSLGHWDYTQHADTLEKFWRDGVRRNKNYENMVTMGLRGANDSEMGGDLASNIAMVENIVKKQQQILSEEVNPDLEKVPQSWCLYKEILDYYNEGMRVPENITLLWADDNWGNVRRLPNAEERKRMGGAGVYYHFDYHGGPRSYEWINTNPIAKVWDQMSLAKQYGADKIWIVNVGHFKGYELPMEYFMNLAWNTNEWTNDNINDYTLQWVTREFGPQYAKEIADIMAKYTKFNGRRKIESLSPDTYSVVNYKEAETVVAEYNAIVSQAETLYAKIPKEQRDAFYQIVLFPTKASALVHELYYTAARNRLYDNQRRASTNQMADRTRELFSADTALMTFYNRVYANGRWNHFMDQTHLGYTSWNPPRVNSLNAITLSKINVPEIASLGVAVEGSSASWPGTDEIATLPTFDPFNGKTHYFEIFNRGKKDFRYHISTNVPWLSLSDTANTMKTTDKRIVVSLNETLLPQGTSQGEIRIRGTGDDIVIAVKGFKPNATEQPKGYVESGGCIAIEAEHFSKNTPQGDRKWIRVEDYGLTLSSMRATAPANAIAATPKKDAPCLEYPLYFFTADSATLSLVTSPLLNFMPDRDIRIAVSIDDNEPQYITNVPKDFKINWDPRGWSSDVVNQSRRSKARLKIDKPGFHTLKVWMVDPGVALQKVIIYTGEQKPSYLGPIESSFAK